MDQSGNLFGFLKGIVWGVILADAKGFRVSLMGAVPNP